MSVTPPPPDPKVVGDDTGSASPPGVGAADAQLFDLLRGAGIAVIALDRRFCIRRYAPGAETIFEVAPSDIGRPIFDVVQTVEDPDLLADTEKVLESLVPAEAEVADKTGRWFRRSIRPTGTGEDALEGLVVLYVEISKPRRNRKVSQEPFRTIFERAAVGIAQIAPNGRFRRVNPAMCAMFGYSADEFSERTYRDVIHAEDLPMAERQIQRLEEGRAETFSLEKRGVTASGALKWFRLTMTAVRDGEGKLRYFDGIVEDISRRKKAEERLQELMFELERTVARRTRSVKLLQEIAVIANESDTVEGAFQLSLEHICREFEWPLGHVCLPHPNEPEAFVDSGIWYVDDPDAFDTFVELTKTTQFRGGEGFVGQVIATGKPHFLPDVTQDATFVRAKAVEGCQIQAGFAFPVLVRDAVVGVLEFFACEESELAVEVIEGLTEVGTQLGRVIERKQLEKQIADATAHEQQVLGQDLHDSVVQELTGLSMLAERLRRDLHKTGSDAEPRAAEIVRQLASLQKQVRQISHGLMPVEISPEGLMAALQTLAHSSAAFYGVKCLFVCPEPVLVENRQAANQLYRIAQEAVQNAARHAEPKHVTIRLENNERTATLSVADDGTGFASAPEDVGGIGFRIMQYRAGLVHGKLDIASAEGRGTVVSCTFPTST